MQALLNCTVSEHIGHVVTALGRFQLSPSLKIAQTLKRVLPSKIGRTEVTVCQQAKRRICNLLSLIVIQAQMMDHVERTNHHRQSLGFLKVWG